MLVPLAEPEPEPAAAPASCAPTLSLKRKTSSIGSDDYLRQISLGGTDRFSLLITAVEFLNTAQDFSLKILRPDSSPDSEPDLRDEVHQLVVKVHIACFSLFHV